MKSPRNAAGSPAADSLQEFERLVLRKAQPGDLDAIHRLECAVFDGDRMSRASLRRFIDAPSVHLVVALLARGRSDGLLAGYALTGFRKGSNKARLYSIAVDPQAGSRGVGWELLGACEKAALARGAPDMRLEVRVDNERAIRLYEAKGYQRFDLIADYYEDGAAALRMRRLLPVREA